MERNELLAIRAFVRNVNERASGKVSTADSLYYAVLMQELQTVTDMFYAQAMPKPEIQTGLMGNDTSTRADAIERRLFETQLWLSLVSGIVGAAVTVTAVLIFTGWIR